MNNKKKTSWFSYLLPYLIIILIIAGIVTIVNMSNKASITYYEGDIIGSISEPTDDQIKTKAEGSVLWTERITSIKVSYYDGFVDISGKVMKSNGKRDGIYSFSSRITGSESNIEVLSYIFQNRMVDGSNDNLYYGNSKDGSEFSISNPYASNFWTDL